MLTFHFSQIISCYFLLLIATSCDFLRLAISCYFLRLLATSSFSTLFLGPKSSNSMVGLQDHRADDAVDYDDCLDGRAERFTIPMYPRPAASIQMLHKLLANPELQLLKIWPANNICSTSSLRWPVSRSPPRSCSSDRGTRAPRTSGST